MKKVIFVLISLLIITGCESLVEGINENPNEPIEAPANLLLVGAELATITVQVSHLQRISGMWSGQYRGVTLLYGSLHNYNISTEETNSTWSTIYQGIVKQCRIIQSELSGFRNFVGVSKVLEAQAIGTAAELFGDIPYSQAVDHPNELIEDPIFDGQRSVFDQMQLLLDDAIDDLSSTGPSIAFPNEIFHNGNRNRWIQTARTLKARFYMDTKDYPNAYAQALLGISTNANSMKFNPPAAPTANGNANLLNVFIGERTDYMTTAGTFLERLINPLNPLSRNNAKTNEQARSKYYAIGGSSANAENGVAKITSPMPLVTYEENLLILAEAGARTQTFATALGHLNTLRTHLASGNAFIKVATADITRYDAYVAADFNPGGIENPDGITPIRALLREIVEERYVSLYGTFIPFNDARRLRKSDTDIDVPFPLNISNTTLYPERFPYAQDELNANSNADPELGIYAVTEVNK
jgi:starch-binding outer membrane protein, SusD/RagB family